MKRFVLSSALLLFLNELSGQSITGLNFRHWYNPQNEVNLQLDLARGQNQLIVNYVLRTTQFPVDQYSVTWERRDSYVAREGAALSKNDSTPTTPGGNEKSGQLSFAVPEKPWILLARVTHLQSQKNWYYFKLMEGIYPKKGWIESKNGVLSENFLRSGKDYTIKSCDEKTMFVSFYKTTSFYQP
ncbi:MAG: hypothetical protein ORN54_12915, partial [Cyclobacteriaceae bacterium]|nr:hypothetical protein [Cyclobacteriaceae bacterium]